MRVIVNCQSKTIAWDGHEYPCRIGRGGFINRMQGQEGDEKTPLGDYFFRFGFYRADRLARPPSDLPFWPMEPNDGWCDDSAHAAYNRFVRLPFEGSHERLWREDGAYDIVLVMNHNDSPPTPGAGSAVFIHIAQPDDRQTLGCVALTPDVMIKLLKKIGPRTEISIR